MENYDWLLKEYEQMFSEKRYYDGRSSALVSLYFVFITIMVSVIAGANNFTEEPATSFYAVPLAAASLIGMVIVVNMYFNRTNYVRVCRQINAIRDFCISNQIPSFKDRNKMYLDADFPQYYMSNSIHLVFMHLVILINSVFICLAFLICTGYELPSIAVTVSIFTVSLFAQAYVLRHLLKNRDKKEISSDDW